MSSTILYYGTMSATRVFLFSFHGGSGALVVCDTREVVPGPTYKTAYGKMINRPLYISMKTAFSGLQGLYEVGITKTCLRVGFENLENG